MISTDVGTEDAPCPSPSTQDSSSTGITTPVIDIPPAPVYEAPLTFEELLSVADMPPPGPDYYAARRELWLKPPIVPISRPLSATSASSRQRLEKILAEPNAIYNEHLWRNSIEKVWMGLMNGGRLKKRLPMAVVVRSSVP